MAPAVPGPDAGDRDNPTSAFLPASPKSGPGWPPTASLPGRRGWRECQGPRSLPPVPPRLWPAPQDREHRPGSPGPGLSRCPGCGPGPSLHGRGSRPPRRSGGPCHPSRPGLEALSSEPPLGHKSADAGQCRGQGRSIALFAFEKRLFRLFFRAARGLVAQTDQGIEL
jgi:hypothetical protein